MRQLVNRKRAAAIERSVPETDCSGRVRRSKSFSAASHPTSVGVGCRLNGPEEFAGGGRVTSNVSICVVLVVLERGVVGRGAMIVVC